MVTGEGEVGQMKMILTSSYKAPINHKADVISETLFSVVPHGFRVKLTTTGVLVSLLYRAHPDLPVIISLMEQKTIQSCE